MIAKVVVDVALDRAFDYAIPESLSGSVVAGSRVVIPFGRRTATGYVLSLSTHSTIPNLKSIVSLQGEAPFISPRMLELAQWMAAYYCAPIETCVRTVLPGAVRSGKTGFKKRLYAAPVEGADTSSVSELQKKVLDALAGTEGSFLSDLLKISGITESPVRTLARKGLLTLERRSQQRDPMFGRRVLPTEPLTLMPEQADALVAIHEEIDAESPKVLLLYGVTGSGKTEVYLQAIQRVLAAGRGVIVLVPEISLTPQTVERFRSRFGSRIAVLHSHLSDGERHDEWHRIRSGDAPIVIGARSAVFAPLPDLGLIVVDEEHEPSYKQSESPRYNARDVAVMRGHMEGCAVVLGSATPAMESWANVQSGKYRLSKLTCRADDRRMPHMRIIDMRIEATKAGHANAFSSELLEAIHLRLERGEQTILFLNRRGFSTSLICPKCGHVAECDHCSVSFTYHRHDEKLRCHICGQDRAVPRGCPACGDPAFRFAGIGTQRVEAITRKCFPHARIARMDSDTMTTKGSYDETLGDFRAGKIDILVGTQMIAKGLHFPSVTLVGVVFADSSLHMPDFRAGERTFQLLAQVAGRAGRGDICGEVIVQTYTPHNVSIQAARRLDYEGLCDQELAFRTELSYPPAAHLVCITLRGKDETEVSACAAALQHAIAKHAKPGVLVSEACPAPLAKAKNYFRYQLMLRSVSAKAMTQPFRHAMADVKMPRSVYCSIDVDALNLM